jgi:serine/threonine protein kinase
LRKKDIVHRDIKPENILLNNHIVKIADFGFAKKVNGDLGMMSFKGTPMTMAPQILEEVPCTNKTDIYSLGATLYFMIFKTYPYNANNLIHLVNKFKAGNKILKANFLKKFLNFKLSRKIGSKTKFYNKK